MTIRIIVPPAQEPVSVADAKEQTRVDFTDDDLLIAKKITAARMYCEEYMWRALITQTIEQYLPCFPRGAIVLQRPRLQSVTNIKYIDEDGAEQTIDSAEYHVDDKSEPARICLVSGGSWPSVETGNPQPITVQFVAGYGDTGASVPEPIRQAIMLKFADAYEMRTTFVVGAAISLMNGVVGSLLNPYKVRTF